MLELNYDKIRSKPRVLKPLTGLISEKFDRLLPAFRECEKAQGARALDEKDARRETPSQRDRGGGRKPVLRTMETRLLPAVPHPPLEGA